MPRHHMPPPNKTLSPAAYAPKQIEETKSAERTQRLIKPEAAEWGGAQRRNAGVGRVVQYGTATIQRAEAEPIQNGRSQRGLI